MDEAKTSLEGFYASVCACENSSEQCPKIQRKADSPPRGFYTNARKGPVDVMVVAKNPGHAMKAEKDIYRNLNLNFPEKSVFFNNHAFSSLLFLFS